MTKDQKFDLLEDLGGPRLPRNQIKEIHLAETEEAWHFSFKWHGKFTPRGKPKVLGFTAGKRTPEEEVEVCNECGRPF